MFDSIYKNAKKIYFRLNLSSKYYRLGNIWGDTEFLGHDIRVRLMYINQEIYISKSKTIESKVFQQRQLRNNELL